jgi:hypothetical protein
MAYRVSGSYIAHCDCTQVCPCAFDEPPTAPDGTCHGLIVFNVKDGNLDGTDVSGTNVALVYSAPNKFSEGNLTLGLVIDEGASDEQADALERIFGGKEGGLWEQFASLASNWLGPERASLGFSDGEEPSATVGDTNVTFEAYRDPDGNVTTARNAPVGLAPEFRLGKSSGSAQVLGQSYDATYGEAAEFEYAA